MKDDVREETGVGAEEVAEERRQLQVPEDYEDRVNNDLWDWDANQEKVKEAEKLLRDTDRCCFCDFDCPPPSEQENEGRLFGVLESLWNHIELSHPLAYEWLGWVQALSDQNTCRWKVISPLKSDLPTSGSLGDNNLTGNTPTVWAFWGWLCRTVMRPLAVLPVQLFVSLFSFMK